MTGPLDALSPRASGMIAMLWAPEQDDPAVVAVMRAGADELDEVVSIAETVRDQAWPHRADDTYGILGLHESMLRLPVAPDATLVQRQAAVKGAITSRKVGSHKNWVARMNTVMRGQQWTYQMNTPGPGQLTIRIPFDQSTYNAAQAQALARRITPAHVEIIMAYNDGFIVGVSRVGQDAL